MDEWPDERLERQTPCEWLDRAVLELGADVVRSLLEAKDPREELELIRGESIWWDVLVYALEHIDGPQCRWKYVRQAVEMAERVAMAELSE